MLEHHPVIRWIVIILGSLLIYVGLLLKFRYDSEKQQIMSYWQRRWIEYDTYHNESLSKQAAFLKVILTTALKILDGLFGSKTFSIQFVSGSLCLSCVGLIGDSIADLFPGRHPVDWLGEPIQVSIFIMLLLLLFEPILMRKKWSGTMRAWLQFVLLCMIAPFGLAPYAFGWNGSEVPTLIEGLVIAIFCDMLFLFGAKSLLRWSITRKSFFAMVTSTVAYLSIAVILVYVPSHIAHHIVIVRNYVSDDSDRLSIVATSNMVEALFFVLLCSITALMAIHRMLLPAINRFAYQFVNPKKDEETAKIDEAAKWLIGLGCAVLVFAGLPKELMDVMGAASGK